MVFALEQIGRTHLGLGDVTDLMLLVMLLSWLSFGFYVMTVDLSFITSFIILNEPRDVLCSNF